MFNDQNSTEVRDRIFVIARELFTKNGFKGTSVRDIASASETNVAMINYYFGSKYKLFEQVFDEAFNILYKRIFSSLSSETSFFDLVENWINSYYELLSAYPHIPNFILNEVSINPERITRLFKEKNPYEIYSIIKKRIEDEVKKGTIRETSPDNFLLSILSLGIFPFLFTNMAKGLLDISTKEYIEMLKIHKSYVVEFVKNSLKP